ncbi:hypothetical protein [Kitasatospora sp. McL0602]|uniref:hypothetical protein n=1 Tax=Kitasatospora sp. McL0602 TaxID=3439530 RepID=UPI003F8BD19C
MTGHLRQWRGIRSAAAAATTAALGLAGVLVPAGDAAATMGVESVPLASLAYTDAQTPTTGYPQSAGGDMPLGSWLDAQGVTHDSRVYATFDLTGFAAKDVAKRVVTASLLLGESQATTYSRRSIEVWQTATPTAPVSWRRAPAEKQLLGTVVTTASGPAGYMQLDLTAAAAAAALAGHHTLSLELRLPEAEEKDPALGRRVVGSSRLAMYAKSNSRPGVPTKTFTAPYACSTKGPYPYVSSLSPSLMAMLHDLDGGTDLKGNFAVWPVDNRDQRKEFTADMPEGRAAAATVPPGILADGGTYGWQVQGDDGTDQSAWSQPCYFHVDATRPTAATVVTSSNYPADQTAPAGVPAEFTFGAGGVADVAGYQYSWTQDMPVDGWSAGPDGTPQWTDPYNLPGHVRASRLGGTAKVTLTPPDAGPQRLFVRSLDRAGNPSDVTMYQFYVPSTMPAVAGAPDNVRLGVPFTLQLAPNAAVAPVDSYTVQVNHDAVRTVPANADGRASLPVTLTNTGGNTITVRSHSTNGWVSSTNEVHVNVDTTPTISSDVYQEETETPVNSGGVGVSGVFTFAPKVANVASYTYSFDYSRETTVRAGADGTAQISWAPSESGQHTLYAYATDAAGRVFDTYYYYFDVN